MLLYDNIIPLGDHCIGAIILKELNLRKCAYPYDWFSSSSSNLDDSNMNWIIENLIKLLNAENINIFIDNLLNNMFGNCFENNDLKNNVNKNNDLWFPHEYGTRIEIISKYKNRFNRLYQDIINKNKNLFIIITRKYKIDENKLLELSNIIKKYNGENKILIISGISYDYTIDNIIFKYIHYDETKFWNYDYTDFRPNIKSFLHHWFEL